MSFGSTRFQCVASSGLYHQNSLNDRHLRALHTACTMQQHTILRRMRLSKSAAPAAATTAAPIFCLSNYILPRCSPLTVHHPSSVLYQLVTRVSIRFCKMSLSLPLTGFTRTTYFSSWYSSTHSSFAYSMPILV